MGMLNWWRTSRARAEAVSRSLAINSDQDLIASQVPELTGMSDVEGMAYVIQQNQDWNKSCSVYEASTFAQRLQSSAEAWQSDGLTMPYWGNLWVLRNYQLELGCNVPHVARPKTDAYEIGEEFAKDASGRLEEYVRLHLAPKRHAFLNVFRRQLETIDERLPQLDSTGDASREVLAGIDYSIMLENWYNRRAQQSEEAKNWMRTQLSQADALGCGEDLSKLIERELDQQRALLTTEGLTLLLRAVPGYEKGIAIP